MKQSHCYCRWYGYSFGSPGQENPTILNQCVAEQKWFRESMLRSLIYLQVNRPTSSRQKTVQFAVTVYCMQNPLVLEWAHLPPSLV